LCSSQLSAGSEPWFFKLSLYLQEHEVVREGHLHAGNHHSSRRAELSEGRVVVVVTTLGV
jgi:hypothetical protein